jgi:hypothetical protein
MVALVKAGKIAYDGAKASACLQVFASHCGAFGGPKPQGPCAGVFKGLGALASPCTVGEQCATGYCKEATAPGCPRACANPVGKGEACMTHDGCAGELLCSAGKCVEKKPVAAGGICDNGLPCVDGYGCFPKDSFDTCEPLTDSGPCGSHKNCKPGAFCDQETCKSVETAGKECGAGKGSCGPKFVCLQPSLGKPGTCGPAPSPASACRGRSRRSRARASRASQRAHSSASCRSCAARSRASAAAS